MSCLSRQPLPYVRQLRAVRCRSGLATGLKVGSQPTGTIPGKGDVSLEFPLAGLTAWGAGFDGRRSALLARLTLVTGPDPAAFAAIAAQRTVATVQLIMTAAMICLRLKRPYMTHSLGFS